MLDKGRGWHQAPVVYVCALIPSYGSYLRYSRGQRKATTRILAERLVEFGPKSGNELAFSQRAQKQFLRLPPGTFFCGQNFGGLA